MLGSEIGSGSGCWLKAPTTSAGHGNYLPREVDLDHLLLLHTWFMTATSQG